jgi:hypothetical protein
MTAMPRAKLKAASQISERAMALMDIAERHQLGTLYSRLEAVVIEAARIETDLRQKIGGEQEAS